MPKNSWLLDLAAHWDSQLRELGIVRLDPDDALKAAWLEIVHNGFHSNVKNGSGALLRDVHHHARTFRWFLGDRQKWKGRLQIDREVIAAPSLYLT